MHTICHAVVATALLLGGLAPSPSAAAPVSPAATDRRDQVDWAQAQPYAITLSEFHFAPARIILRQGQPYALRLQNSGRFTHTFTAPAFFRAVEFKPGGAATEAQASGGLSLAAGEVVELDVVPLQAGTYALECAKPLHGLFGMSGDIVVQ